MLILRAVSTMVDLMHERCSSRTSLFKFTWRVVALSRNEGEHTVYGWIYENRSEKQNRDPLIWLSYDACVGCIILPQHVHEYQGLFRFYHSVTLNCFKTT